MRKKIGFAAALVLVSAALVGPRLEASTCTAACQSQESACITACQGDFECRGNCIDQWNACLGNVCHIYR
jgi:hypothetical protein